MSVADCQAPTLQSEVMGEEEFLAGLGRRVRELREQRGMTRKVLAQQAGVSARYLAQLEVGKGNVSIVLLRSIALALRISLAELLSGSELTAEQKLIRRALERLPAHRLEELVFRLMWDAGHGEADRNKRIALIGLRGAGKSTLGNMLAKELHLPFVELDREIERGAGMGLSEVFLFYGQTEYRRLERCCLENVIQTYDRAVITVGGGMVSEPETYSVLRVHCFTAWIRAAPEEHMSRVIAQGDLRPMRGNEQAMEELRRILQTREPLYRQADVVVNTSGQTPEESLLTLRQSLIA